MLFSKPAQAGNGEKFKHPFSFTTDNAAMIGITGYFKYLEKKFTDQSVVPLARMEF